jgi:hypothetical protein
MQIEITEQEGTILADVLRSYLGDLRAEIYKTEARSLKEDLKEREAALVAVLGRLPAQTDR